MSSEICRKVEFNPTNPLQLGTGEYSWQKRCPVIVCILSISYLMSGIVAMVCKKKSQNQTRQGCLLKVVKGDGFSSSV